MHPDLEKAGLWNRASIYWSNADDTRLQSQFFRLISICVVHWRYILGYQHNLQRHNRENSYCPCVDAQNPWWNTFGHHKGNEETNKVDPQASFLSQIGNVSTISFVLQSHDTECDSRTSQCRTSQKHLLWFQWARVQISDRTKHWIYLCVPTSRPISCVHVRNLGTGAQ